MKKITALLSVCLLLVGCTSTPSSNQETENKELTGQINVYTRDASSGTREAYEKASDFEDMLLNTAIEVSSNGDMETKVGADRNGIGYVSMTTDFAANGVIPIQFEGVSPSEEAALDGTYKLQRPFDFVTRAAGDFGDDAKEQLVVAFIDYLQNSEEGMLVVEKAGGIVDKTKAKPWSELAANHPIVEQDNSAITIMTAGSTSVEKTLKEALESFVPMAGNFQFTMNQTGSGDGYKRVLGSEKDGANKADIGFASRAFNSDEDISSAMISGTYCLDAVVTIVNAENTSITNLSAEQIKAIFTGEVSNWEDIK